MGDDGSYGVTGQGVEDAITKLDQCKEALYTWRDEMMKKKTLVVADWLGTASGTFNDVYNTLDANMATMEDAVQAFKLWAADTGDGYAQLDAHTNTMMESI